MLRPALTFVRPVRTAGVAPAPVPVPAVPLMVPHPLMVLASEPGVVPTPMDAGGEFWVITSDVKM